MNNNLKISDCNNSNVRIKPNRFVDAKDSDNEANRIDDDNTCNNNDDVIVSFENNFRYY